MILNDNHLVREYYDISVTIQQQTKSMLFKYNRMSKIVDAIVLGAMYEIVKKYKSVLSVTDIEQSVKKSIFNYISDFDFRVSTYEQFCSGLLEVQSKVVDDEFKRLGEILQHPTGST